MKPVSPTLIDFLNFSNRKTRIIDEKTSSNIQPISLFCVYPKCKLPKKKTIYSNLCNMLDNLAFLTKETIIAATLPQPNSNNATNEK